MMLTALADIVDDYDVFLIDQFGVLLSGDGAYPWAPDALLALGRADRRIILLSNSGKRATPNEERLSKLGFVRDCFQMVLSSGEAAYADLAGRLGHDLPSRPRVWLHARDDDTSMIEGLPVTLVEDAEGADLVIIAGSQAEHLSLDWYRAALHAAAQKGVPALCTNPDMSMLTPEGQKFGAGRIATLYEEMGGTVDWVGKPFPLIYKVARGIAGYPDPGRVLCIGDSPAHDIRGGRAAGFATALVRTGLHAELSDADLIAHCREAGDIPDFIIPRFEL